MKLLALVLISFNVLASQSDIIQCRSNFSEILNLEHDPLNEVVTYFKECPTEKDKIHAKIKKDFDHFYGNKKINTGTVKGIKLKAPAGMLTMAVQMFGKKTPSGWKDAAKNCETLICAFTNLLGSETAALQVFTFKARSGYLLSFDQSINGRYGEQIWSPKEIQELDAAAEKLPPSLRNLKLKRIERYKDGLRQVDDDYSVAAYASPAPKNDPRLHFYDRGLKGSPTGPNSYTSTSWPQEVLLHELCHHHDYKDFWKSYDQISSKAGSQFKAISGWKKKNTKDGKWHWDHNHKEGFTRDYAESSPAEDYAESCMAYVLYPQKLKRKSPKKYAYMKKHLFKNKEYLNKPWAKNKAKKWPMLNELLANEDNCQKQMNQCLKKIQFDFGTFRENHSKKNKDGSTTISSRHFFSTKDLFNQHECLKEMRNNRLKNLEKELKLKDKKYCDYGGDAMIKQNKGLICKNSINNYKENINKLKKLDAGEFLEECEKNKDFTQGCIRKQIISKLEIPSNQENGIISNLINDRIPKRLESLGSELSKLPTNEWLKECLKDVSDIDFYQNMTYYNSDQSKIRSGQIGRYISSTYSRSNDIQENCAHNLLNAFKNQGYKFDEKSSEHPNLLLKSGFAKEFLSFEKEVLTKIPQVTKKCLISKKCKLKRIQELLVTWQNSDTTKRRGLEDSELVEHLLNIAKFKLDDF